MMRLPFRSDTSPPAISSSGVMAALFFLVRGYGLVQRLRARVVERAAQVVDIVVGLVCRAVGRLLAQQFVRLALAQAAIEGREPVLLLAPMRPPVVFPEEIGGLADLGFEILVDPGIVCISHQKSVLLAHSGSTLRS